MQIDEKALETLTSTYKAAFDSYMRNWVDDKTASTHPGRDATKAGLRAVLAALSKQKPVVWQRLHPVAGWQNVDEADIEHYRSYGQEIRPLYASPLPVRPITDEDVKRAAKAVSDEWGKMVAEMSPHMSPGDIARSFVSPGNHRLIRAALEAAGGRG